MDKKAYPQIILLGDSIVQYSSYLRDGFSFTACLEEHCTRRLQVVNLGLSGYNTSHALKIFEHLIPDPASAKVAYLLILFGANDACLPGGPTGQHVPLQKYKDNIKAILTHPSVKAQNPEILLVTPPPINEVHLEEEDQAKGYGSLTRLQEHTAKYSAAARDIALEFKDRRVSLVDLWQAIMQKVVHSNPGATTDIYKRGTKDSGDDRIMRSLLTDGLHLSGEGYRIFWEEVRPLVGKQWSQEPLDAPSWVFPHHRQLIERGGL
ncbi:GDSL Lipase Acylhydrolase family protein [Rutstroemia sp. NJR-2017a WRK4]|nr:GDSL Lipase Acylhydrolase family protein [Rutstroemia sp. NJR-2017a WRK4]